MLAIHPGTDNRITRHGIRALTTTKAITTMEQENKSRKSNDSMGKTEGVTKQTLHPLNSGLATCVQAGRNQAAEIIWNSSENDNPKLQTPKHQT